MSKVHILPPELVSKIAAGEVIDRPAAVVKELVENALDAGADTIEVSLKEAGKTLIRVKDNGQGIDADDLKKIFLRHATSKITKAEDLFDIHSLGFRGEALYSIAAIADIVLRTKTPEGDSGWEIHLRGGGQLSLRPSPLGPHGTEIEIKELFYNTPARRKFLKSNISEMNQILNILIPYTLLFSKIRFKLSHRDKDLLDLSPAAQPTDRVAAALNLNSKHLVTSEQKFPEKNTAVRVVLGDINIQRRRRDLQFIFVNNRPVQSRAIGFHMNQIYRLVMPEGAYPFFVVSIDLPPEDVDVNIHPTKREVKIKDEQGLCSLLRRFCEETLMEKSGLKQACRPADRFPEGTGRSPATSENENLFAQKPFQHEMYKMPPEALSPTEQEKAQESEPPYAIPSGRSPGGAETQDFFIPSDNAFTRTKENLHSKLTNARYIGAFLNKFLLFESGASLLLVDQHAAQERIAYEQFIVQMQKGTVEVQHLLSPIVLKLTPQELLFWEESQALLETAGLSTSQWDKESIAVHTHPQLVKDTEQAVREILAGGNPGTCDHETLARRACRSSIMAGDRLNPEQAEYQRGQLLKCLAPFTCPHGRPTVIEMTENFLDKQFLRK